MVTHGFVDYPAERGHEIAGRVREYLETAPDEVFVSFGVATGTEDDGADMIGRPVPYVGATYSGPVDAAEEVLRPLRDLGPVVDTFRQVPYLELQTANDEEMVWGKRFYMKGGFLAELSDDFVDAALANVSTSHGAMRSGPRAARSRVSPMRRWRSRAAMPRSGSGSRPTGTTQRRTTR